MRSKFSKFQRRLERNRQQQIKRFRRLRAHPVMIPIATVLILLVVCGISWRVFGQDDTPPVNAFIVVISHDGAQQTVPSREPTVGALLKKLHLTLNTGDVVEPSPDTPINQDDFRINIYRAVPVEIVDGTKHTFTFSAATTPRSIAQQAGVNVHADDELATNPVQNFVADHAIGEQVVIKRSIPITLNLYGTKIPTRTNAQTVAELLKEKQITLAAGETVVPAKPTLLSAGSKVFILRKGTKLVTKQVAIAMPVETIQDASLTIGTSAVRQRGSAGEKAITYEIDKDGHRTPIQTVVIRQPVTQIEVRGVNLGGIRDDMRLAGISPGDYSYVDYVFTHESHWNPAAVNGIGCAGLGQACPGSKLAAACPDWQSDPVCQIKFFTGYADGRYGGWAGAYSHKASYGWW